jgi:signal transduction histidine kinase
MDALPSLPRVLVRILDVLQDESADPRALGRIVLQDIGLTTRVIAATRASPGESSRFESVEQAIRTLGLSAIKTLVTTAAMQQVFEQFSPRRQRLLNEIWRRALTTASLGKALAVLTGYRRPEDAYLAGLFTDVGRLVRLTAIESEYDRLLEGVLDDTDPDEASKPGPTQVAAGVALLEHWGLDPFLVDAVRFHLEPARKIRDAHHLVKLTHLAHAMASSDPVSGPTLEASDLLFGLNEGLTRELHRHARDEIAQLATVLQIDIRGESAGGHADSDRLALGQRLQDLEQLEQLQGELAEVGPQISPSTVQKVVSLTLGVEKSLLFLVDEEVTHLCAWAGDETEPAFVLRLEEGRSLVTDALINRRTIQVFSRDRKGLSVIDQQIFGICSAEVLWIQPLAKGEASFGVLVLGLAHRDLPRIKKRAAFVQTLGLQIARATIAHQTPVRLAGAADLEQHVREMVHEASNPLSIVQNYLAMLRIKLGERHDAQQEIGIITEEIERVGRILKRMSERPTELGLRGESLNVVVRQVSDLFSASMGAAQKIAIEVELCPDVPPTVEAADPIRQILTNLLKNAAEALKSGGHIRIATKHPVSVGGRRYTELVVEDNGPGLPPEIMADLFSPGTAIKGSEQRGLGLSIVKRLADDMDAILLCSSSHNGTRFQLLLPNSA